MISLSTLLVTGGAGFIGVKFVAYWRRLRPDRRIVIFDALTYAGNFDSLASFCDDRSCKFVRGDICDAAAVEALFGKYDFDVVVRFAAESHVDRSIHASQIFTRTNVQGTHVLLDAALAAWRSSFVGRQFHHISTDEVFGSLGGRGAVDRAVALRSEIALCRQQGGQRFSGPVLRPHPRSAGDDH